MLVRVDPNTPEEGEESIDEKKCKEAILVYKGGSSQSSDEEYASVLI